MDIEFWMKDVKLLLLNLNMPFMDGLSVFREIRKISPKIKAVLITGTLEIDGVKESLILLKKIYEILREEN
ncbi:MAG: response regulator transcription factor [Dictyoglomus sp.]|jgi:CheY-like chemotaxis protein|uniref:response regulator transcription factor n=1 Tax=Dictyoglomus sp. TaxID=28205 RepID=UPI000CCFABE7|nr:MAG: hypothetical protein C0196_02615 [Dictyoglomus turgidum]